LVVAAARGARILILGAYGCGVFHNQASHVAAYFYAHLITGSMRNVFQRVIFAIPRDTAKLDSFRRVFAPAAQRSA